MPTASDAEIDAFIEAAQKELLENDYHAYYKMYPPLNILFNRYSTAVWAQRPQVIVSEPS